MYYDSAFVVKRKTFFSMDATAFAFWGFNDAIDGIDIANLPMQNSETQLDASNTFLNLDFKDFAFWEILFPDFERNQNMNVLKHDNNTVTNTDNWEQIFLGLEDNETAMKIKLELQIS